jgi:Ni/Co efflux regulator RcnB
MKKLLISAFAISIASAAPTALWAQEQHDQHPPPGGEHGAPSGGSPRPMSAPDRMRAPSVGRPSNGAPSYHHTVTHHTSTYHPTTSYHRTTSHVTTNAHIDINTYHRNVTAERRFHYGDYHAPRGYEYRRWSYGDHLPAIYFERDYWIPNYWNFGLAWAPDGCEWVRFGPDAVLVDIDTGEVIQVVYDVFY